MNVEKDALAFFFGSSFRLMVVKPAAELPGTHREALFLIACLKRSAALSLSPLCLRPTSADVLDVSVSRSGCHSWHTE
jgi:hypothetical protein